jgi:hypothetical protein
MGYERRNINGSSYDSRRIRRGDTVPIVQNHVEGRLCELNSGSLYRAFALPPTAGNSPQTHCPTLDFHPRNTDF